MAKRILVTLSESVEHESDLMIALMNIRKDPRVESAEVHEEGVQRFRSVFNAAAEFKHGVYRHYKGGLYRTVSIARHHETGEPMVVYVSLSKGTLNVRELGGDEGFLSKANASRPSEPQIDRFVFAGSALE